MAYTYTSEPPVERAATTSAVSLLASRSAPPLPSAQALSGRRVAISPGHGYYFTGSSWGLQRPLLQGIVEDFVNHDFVTILNHLLGADGADVRSTRNLDRNAGNGESGFPKWQEAARYHVKALGADPAVWNESGFTHLEQDIRCRPRYANAIEAELLVSIHNNGGGGTGTETLYDTGNAFAAQNKRLADVLHQPYFHADADPHGLGISRDSLASVTFYDSVAVLHKRRMPPPHPFRGGADR